MSADTNKTMTRQGTINKQFDVKKLTLNKNLGNEQPKKRWNLAKLKVIENHQPVTNKRKLVTPIIITTKITEYNAFTENITQTLGHNQFTTRYNGNNTNIYARDMNDFNKINEELKNSNTEYET